MNRRIAFLAAALGMVGLAGSHSAVQAKTLNTVHEQKATEAKRTQTRSNRGNYTEPFDPDMVMLRRLHALQHLSPREYGMRYGNGASRNGKTNKLACSHRAKVGRR